MPDEIIKVPMKELEINGTTFEIVDETARQQAGAIIDSALSDTSTYPVQNKVIKGAIDDLKSASETENAKISNMLDSLTFDKTTLQMTEAATGAVLNDGQVHTEGAYGANIVYSSVSVTSDYVGKTLLVTGYCWYAIEPFVFVGTSGKIVNAGFPNPGNDGIVYRNTIFIPAETGTLYVNGRISIATDRAVSAGSIYGIDSDWINKSIENLQEKPYSFEEASYSIQNSYCINRLGLVIPLQVQDNRFVVCSPIDVSNISKVHIVASANYGNAFFAFYDEDGISIYCETAEGGSTSATVEYYDDVVIVPEFASTLRIAYIASDVNNIPVLVTKAVYQNINLAEVVAKQNEHTDILSDIAIPVFSSRDGTLQNGKYLNGAGAVGDYADGVLLTASVTPGENIEITGECWGGNYYYSFFNSADAFISGAHGDPSSGIFVQYVKTAVVVPAGAAKVCVSGRASVPPVVYEVSGYKTSKWEGKKWVVVGDSLTEHNGRTTKNYHDYISEATGITVVNMGVSGSGYRNATSAGNKAFYQRISSVPIDADVVTIFGSFNDGISDIGTADDTGTETLGGCVNTTIDNLYAVFPTVQLGIVSPTPWIGANPYDHSAANAYADLLEAICKKRSIPFLNLYYESNLRPWDSTFRTLAYSKDDGNGVHPDETGHKIIASRFEAFLDSLLLH